MAIDLEKLLNDLRLQIKSDININLSEQEERITTRINKNIDEKFNHIQMEIEEIKQTNEDQETRLALVEKQIRARNLIFFGVEEGEKSYEELERKIITIIDKMGIICNQNDLEIVRRMRKPSQDKIRPINITLITYGKKVSILKKKKTLENTTIYIKEDFPPQILEVRKSLQNQLQKERNEGHNAYIRYDKIVVRKPDRTQQLGYSKKRELEITPPSSVCDKLIYEGQRWTGKVPGG